MTSGKTKTKIISKSLYNCIIECHMVIFSTLFSQKAYCVICFPPDVQQFYLTRLYIYNWDLFSFFTSSWMFSEILSVYQSPTARQEFHKSSVDHACHPAVANSCLTSLYPVNACSPVIARPNIKAWISCVPG